MIDVSPLALYMNDINAKIKTILELAVIDFTNRNIFLNNDDINGTFIITQVNSLPLSDKSVLPLFVDLVVKKIHDDTDDLIRILHDKSVEKDKVVGNLITHRVIKISPYNNKKDQYVLHGFLENINYVMENIRCD